MPRGDSVHRDRRHKPSIGRPAIEAFPPTMPSDSRADHRSCFGTKKKKRPGFNGFVIERVHFSMGLGLGWGVGSGLIWAW